VRSPPRSSPPSRQAQSVAPRASSALRQGAVVVVGWWPGAGRRSCARACALLHTPTLRGRVIGRETSSPVRATGFLTRRRNDAERGSVPRRFGLLPFELGAPFLLLQLMPIASTSISLHINTFTSVLLLGRGHHIRPVLCFPLLLFLQKYKTNIHAYKENLESGKKKFYCLHACFVACRASRGVEDGG
jgi:hypothetical protein